MATFRNSVAGAVITAEEAQALLDYDPDTGILTWKKLAATFTKIGSPAGSIKKSDGYVEIVLGQRRYKAHRIAWLIHFGEWPAGCIDHVNRCRSDNRLANLRVATARENACNTRKSNLTGFRGVFVHHTRKSRPGWVARIESRHLGVFDSPEAAAQAYDAAARRHHGQFAILNFPDEAEAA